MKAVKIVSVATGMVAVYLDQDKPFLGEVVMPGPRVAGGLGLEPGQLVWVNVQSGDSLPVFPHPTAADKVLSLIHQTHVMAIIEEAASDETTSL